MTRYERVMGLVPFGLLAALGVWTLASPAGVVQTFAGVAHQGVLATTVREAMLIALLFCAGAAVSSGCAPPPDHVVALGRRRLRRGRHRRHGA